MANRSIRGNDKEGEIMKKLKVKLMQHTPLIHFQHNQYEATLRASEVKPKLDRFILTQLGEGNYNNGSDKAKKEGWLIGKGVNRALDYKIHVSVDKKKDDVNLKITKENGKSYTTNFPMLLSNMGGKDTDDELVNFSMYENVYLDFFCRHDGLLEEIKDFAPYFFANINFGQRSNKGFGSFTVTSMKYEDSIIPVNSIGTEPYYIPKYTLYMDFAINESMYLLQEQINLFKIIESFWNQIKSQIKSQKKSQIKSEDVNKFELLQSYIKEKELNPDKRKPAPVIFKPISYKESNKVRYSVYIMSDKDMLGKLLIRKSNLTEEEKNLETIITYSIEYIDNFIIGDSESRSVNGVKVKFYEQ